MCRQTSTALDNFEPREKLTQTSASCQITTVGKQGKQAQYPTFRDRKLEGRASFSVATQTFNGECESLDYQNPQGKWIDIKL